MFFGFASLSIYKLPGPAQTRYQSGREEAAAIEVKVEAASPPCPLPFPIPLPMDSSRLLKKPKLEDEAIELNGETLAAKQDVGGNSGDASRGGGNDGDSLTEQEEALVALIEHRTKECQIIKKKIAHYQSQVFSAN